MLSRSTPRVVVLAAVLAGPGLAHADNKTGAAVPAPGTAPKGAVSAQSAAAPATPEDRAGYDAAGRRDPFVSLLSRGESRLPEGGRPIGVKGLLIGELSVRGVLRTKGRLLAIVQAPDKKTYTVHPGDSLFDGSVKVVANDAVIFLQRVDDPLSPVKQREIRKTLRTPEETR